LFSDGFFNGLYIIPILAILIIVHELGHFFAARRCGVKVEEFGIGIPPRIKGWTRNGVIWSLNWIPFGGFVRVKGEDGANQDSDSMNAKRPYQRAFFLVAGAGMNVLLAVFLMVAIIGAKGVRHVSVYAVEVVPGSPAAKAGWQGGDRIVAIDGEQVKDSSDLTWATRVKAGQELAITIERRNEEVVTRLVPRENPPEGQGRVGIRLDNAIVRDIFVEEVVPDSAAAQAGMLPGDRLVSVNERAVNDEFVLRHELRRYEGFAAPLVVERSGAEVPITLQVPELDDSMDTFVNVGLSTLRNQPWYEQVSAVNLIPRGFEESYDTTVRMIRGIRELFSSRENLRQIAGPVGMGQLTSEIVGNSADPIYDLTFLAIILSLNLAVLNLLPLPALDGGRLLFVLIEVLRGGRKIAPEKEGLVHFAGLVVLIGFMFVVGFFDVNRIIDGNSFLP